VITYKNQIEANHDRQFSINFILKDKIENKNIQFKKDKNPS
jgi:hypothetical protein